jgi:hypothetical protein
LVSAVLPSENPALLVISQIKKLAVANEAYLSNIKVAVSGQTDSKTENAEISFDIKGQINSVLNLISEIKKVAPLIQVDSVKLSLDSDIAQATVQVRTYWAPYPTKMPALTEPTSGLSNSEQVLLVDLTDLELPDFDTNLVPTSPVENPNPFGE